MYKTIATLAFAASLFSLPVMAQQPGAGHDAHHPESAQTEAPAMQPPGMGPGMGMMNCPMMSRGMMGGMNMGGMGAMHGAGMRTGGPVGDQSVASVALNAVNEKMHRDMAIAFTGNVDADFVTAMIVHHQGAIDMAKVVKAFGEDEEIRELADAIIVAQEGEISMMREWLARNAQQ
jgi:uncharacterized protein (DUF305 family)